MPAASSHPANTTGHAGFHPTLSAAGAPTVFINGKPAMISGIPFIVHSNPSPSAHVGTSDSGSGSVSICGQPACRVGDSLSCGDVIASGSPNVFIGG